MTREEQIESVVAAHDGADVDALRRYLASPEVAVITLTVTEGGYGLDADGDPDLADAEVRSDLDALRAGASTAQTVLGRLILGLDARRRAGAGPIAIVPCDNIPANGSFVARGITGFAEQVDTGLADWIRSHVSFVSTSVDRITPQAAEGEIVTEPFTDWVLAGEFPAGRPRWESAGARFVDDIEPWENRKLWLLNGAHCVLAFTGIPKGLETVSDAIADAECRALVEDFWSEAVACLPPGTEHEALSRAAGRTIRQPPHRPPTQPDRGGSDLEGPVPLRRGRRDGRSTPAALLPPAPRRPRRGSTGSAPHPRSRIRGRTSSPQRRRPTTRSLPSSPSCHRGSPHPNRSSHSCALRQARTPTRSRTASHAVSASPRRTS